MHWINPVFVCEVKFAEWTRNKKLRAPVFLGLSEDKKASEVVREVLGRRAWKIEPRCLNDYLTTTLVRKLGRDLFTDTARRIKPRRPKIEGD